MSHNILDNQIAWKGETPWHGLGYEVPANATGAEMLKIAKLDWKVQRRAIAMRSADGSKNTMLTDPLKDYRAIVRADTDQVFQVASNRYQVVQNQDIVDFFREYCDAGRASMETVGGLFGGAKIWALAKLNGGSDANIGGVDPLKGYMLLTTSHDGTSATIGRPTQTRVVCANTLACALGEGKSDREVRIRHSRKWTPELAEAAKRTMGLAIEQIQSLNSLAAQFARIKVDGRGKLEFLRKLLNQDKIETAVIEPTAAEIDAVLMSMEGQVAEISEKEIVSLGRTGQNILEAVYSSPGSDLVTAKDTLWGAINGVTYYVDHVRGRSQDSRLENAWFGSGSTLKEKAVEVAAELAGIKA